MTGETGSERVAADTSPTLVLGVGNVLLMDEGVGVHAVRQLEQQYELPSHVKVLDGGTAAFDLIYMIDAYERVIVIDAVKGGGEPGAVYRFTPDDITPEDKLITSIHQVEFLDILDAAELMGCKPREIIIYGIEPHTIGWGEELSPEIAAMVPKVIDLVLKELGIAIR